ncbi:hypothetical protein [Caldibacillus debilis]|uniref:Secreted protein n=1 Tax=Caldibacillus debilis TaxID=301148 RepID=A0A150M4E6_9BACI|nr:hypothetical protein [Caldibacillus debilis]KYD19231.1 hypothetical protein B4135_2155 [Caldibacillus debilis]
MGLKRPFLFCPTTACLISGAAPASWLSAGLGAIIRTKEWGRLGFPDPRFFHKFPLGISPKNNKVLFSKGFSFGLFCKWRAGGQVLMFV